MDNQIDTEIQEMVKALLRYSFRDNVPSFSALTPTEQSIVRTPENFRKICDFAGVRRVCLNVQPAAILAADDAVFLWKIEWTPDAEFDVWTSAIVAAKTADQAMDIHPSGTRPNWSHSDAKIMRQWATDDRWAPNPSLVRPTRIGTAGPSIRDGEVLLAVWISG